MGQAGMLLPSEASQGIPAHEGFKGNGIQISQSKLRSYEMIAGIYIPIGLHHRDLAAFLPEDAKAVILAHGRCQGFFDDLNPDPADIIGFPFIKDSAEKVPEFFRINAGRFIHHWKKADISCSHRFEKTVDFKGMVHIMVVDHTQDIMGNLIGFQEGQALHHPGMGPLSRPGEAALIMEVLRAVQAQPHGKPRRFKKFAPGYIQQGSVGLDAVLDEDMSRLMFFLEPHGPVKKIQACQGGFPAMPGKAYHRAGMGLDVPADIGFQDIVRHPWAGPGTRPFGGIITVLTGQVAGIPDGFGKDLEIGFDGKV
jgi:hypothetical protein